MSNPISVRPLAALALAALVAFPSLPVQAAPLSPTEQKIVQAVDSRREAAIALLQGAVDVPSATENLAGVQAVAEVFARELEELGFETRWEALPSETGRAGHLVAVHPGDRGRRVLLLGHLDTVLEGERFRREGDRAWGSGVSDMKGGDVILIEALRALQAAGSLQGRAITVVLTGDEERAGQPHEVTRRPLLEAAKDVDVVLAFEGYAPGYAVVGRRGSSSWRLEVEGKQAHSSGIFSSETGDGAVFELARILDAFRRELPEPQLTFNPSLMVGGTDATLDSADQSARASGKSNVVPRIAVAEGDLRFLTREQKERTRQRMREIVSRSLPRTSSRIEFQDGMPSMEPAPGNRELLRLLDAVSRDLGTGPMAEHDPSRRGAGDIAFLPETLDRLDGLGALGESEHAPGEWIDLKELPALTKRAALLMYRLR